MAVVLVAGPSTPLARAERQLISQNYLGHQTNSEAISAPKTVIAATERMKPTVAVP